MSKNSVQSIVVIVQVARLVVAVGPFTLHQERPRHVFFLYLCRRCSGLKSSTSLHFSPRCSDFISGQIGILLVDRRDGVRIFGRLLRMRREAVSFTRCRGAGGQKQDHHPHQHYRPPKRISVDMGLERTYCMSLMVKALNVTGAESHKRKFTGMFHNL